MTSLLREAESLSERVISFRRSLHRHPEIGLTLPRTQQAVLDEIADMDLDVRTSEQTSAVVAELAGAKPGPTVILRGDMDALPLQEDTGLDFASENAAMHACGHDTHVAMLAGAARILAGRRDELAGRVLFFFQPGEEGYHGAQLALEEGLLDVDGAVAGAFALHISTIFETGTLNVRPGRLMAAADWFVVTLDGSGGHASAPHQANDPVPAACEIATTLQVVLSRKISAFEPAVLTVARIAAGTTHNIIPASAEMMGTIRTFSAETRTAVHGHLSSVVEGVASAHGLTAEVEITPGYPPTINDAGFTERVHAVAAETIGAESVVEMDDPLMGAEDFSYVLQRYPGAMAFLGACPPDLEPGASPSNHSNLVVFDESALAKGVAIHAAVTLHLLR